MTKQPKDMTSVELSAWIQKEKALAFDNVRMIARSPKEEWRIYGVRSEADLVKFITDAAKDIELATRAWERANPL